MFWPSRLDFLLKKIKLPVPIDTWERRARPAMPAGLRLIITEGPRFPQLAEFHYREVLSRALAAVRGLLRHAIDRGEIAGDALVRFPQLLIAPGIVAIIWSGLFDRFEPLDVRALMRAHLDILFGEGRPP